MAGPSDGVVLYQSRYGATQQYPEWMRKELRIPMIDPERLDDLVLRACNFIVIGTPVYRGRMLIRDWLRDNQHRLRETRLFLMIVCTHFSDREKQMTMIRDNIPYGMLPSCEAWFMPGKVIIADLCETDAQYLNVATLTERERAEKDAAMLASDPIQKENILPVIKAVRSFTDSLQRRC